MIEALIKEVEATVSPVYLVGGSVRDIVLKKEPKDYDFCTPLSPDEIETAVKKAGRRAYLTGKRFGTIGFKCDGRYIEVTTFRREQYTPGSRKPQVEFVTDLKEDLSRRDFTINAMAMQDGDFVDPHGGRLDILARKIKAVGEARDRFKDDPLRMLRACRFAAQLGFDIDPNMIGKIRQMAYMITYVSRERWVQEIDKLLCAPEALKGLDALLDTHLMKFMLPEVWELGKGDTIAQVESMRHIQSILPLAENNPDIRWGILLMDIGRPYAWKADKGDRITYPRHEIIGREMARGICARLKFSNKRTDVVDRMVIKQTI